MTPSGPSSKTLPARRRRALALLLPPLLAACGSDPAGSSGTPVEQTPEKPGLRVVAEQRGLPVGTAVDRGFSLPGTSGSQFRALVAREFNVLVAENDMKHERLQPARGSFSFARADSLVAFAEANRMKVRGHTLVWHQQNARWLTSGSWTADEARALLREHVETVVGHFRGRVAAWDVVNEAIGDDARFRNSVWYQALGREYVELAFRWANAADPGAALFYNDYGIEWAGAKSDSTYNLLADLRRRGVPVHGVGFQMHNRVGQVPSRDALKQMFARYAALGLKIHVTELDVRVPLPTTTESLAAQAQNYRDVVDACTQTPACETVVVWGLSDADSWVPATFPGFGAALLFDADLKPKPAYWAVHDLLSTR